MTGPRIGCGCMASRTGCLIIGWLEVVLLIPVLIRGLVLILISIVELPYEATKYWKHDYKQYFALGGITTLAIGTLFICAPCFLIHGTTKEKPSFVLAYIVSSVVRNLILIGVFVGGPPHHWAFYFLSLGIEFYKTAVCICHYNYISEKPAGSHNMENVSYAK